MGKITDAYRKELKYLDKLNLGKDALEFETQKAIKAIKKFTPVGNQFVYAARFPDMKFIYTSLSVFRVLGVKPEFFKSPDEFFSLIHPDDLPIILNATLKSLSVGDKLRNFHENDNVFHMDFRMKKLNGDYIRVQRQTGLLTNSNYGQIATTFGIVTDISHIKNSEKIILKMTGSNIPGFKFESDLIGQKKLFTKQEQKIINHIIRGNSSKIMADELNISAETVKTHRKNIMKKSGRKNSSDLVAWVIKNGF